MTLEPIRTLPVAPTGVRRLSLPDALRGFGLLGVLMINLLGMVPGHAMQGLLLLTFASVSIGIAIGRVGALRESVVHRRSWQRLLRAGLCIGLIAVAGAGVATGWLTGDAGTFATRVLRDVALLASATFCTAAFVLLFQRAAWRHWLQKLAPAGRMALTNCLVQALFGLCLMHGNGVAFDLASLVLMGTAFFALQAVFSCCWLARYRLGPAEWLWLYRGPGPRQGATAMVAACRLIQ